MYKKIILFIFLGSISAIKSFGQLTPAAGFTKTEVLVMHVPGLVSNDEASGLKDDLDNFNPAKIVGTTYDLTHQTFHITCTSQFNAVEIMAFFRDNGFEPWFKKGDYIFRLNGTSSDLVQLPYSPTED